MPHHGNTGTVCGGVNGWMPTRKVPLCDISIEAGGPKPDTQHLHWLPPPLPTQLVRGGAAQLWGGWDKPKYCVNWLRCLFVWVWKFPANGFFWSFWHKLRHEIHRLGSALGTFRQGVFLMGEWWVFKCVRISRTHSVSNSVTQSSLASHPFLCNH